MRLYRLKNVPKFNFPNDVLDNTEAIEVSNEYDYLQVYSNMKFILPDESTDRIIIQKLMFKGS